MISNMDVVVIFNGLGNQMSQYAFYLAKNKNDDRCKVIFSSSSVNEHNGSELDRLFGVKYGNGILEKILRIIYKYYEGIPRIRKIFHILGVRVIRENRNYDYDLKYLQKSPKFGLNFYVGGWHSERYYRLVKKEIKKTFSFDVENEDEDFLTLFNKIRDDKKSVSVHVRKGDYVGHPDFDGIANKEYYERSMRYWREKLGNPRFYIFSNNIESCKGTFDSKECTFVNLNENSKAWRDMAMMSACKHHIIANSTFSWWGAWLSDTKEETVCPVRFLNDTITKDIYPDKWIKL